MIRLGAVLCALSLLVHAATATDFQLVWDAAKYGGIVANPGDTVTFTYGDNSDLWIHPTGSCEQSGRIQLGEFGPGSAVYNFTDSDIASPITFATSVEDNCAAGQIITFTIVAATDSPSTIPTISPTTTPPTRVPTTPFPTTSPTPYPTIVGATKFQLQWFVAAYGDVEAFPGDSVSFTYDEFSDVWIHPSGDCSLDGSIFVGSIGPGSVTYFFTEEDAGKTITFTSSVSDNCQQGQIINFNIAGRPTPPTIVPLTPAPSIAPQTAAPILAPVRPFPTLPPVPTVAPTVAPVAPQTPAPVGTPTTPTAPTPVDAPTTPTAPTPVDAPTTPTAPTPVDAPTIPTAPTPVDAPTIPTAPTPVDAPTAPTAPTPATIPTAPTPVDAPTTPTAPTPVDAPTTPTAPTPVDAPTTPTAPTPVDAPTAPSPPGDGPTVTPGSPTTAPVVPEATTARATDLSQKLLGMTACDTQCQDAWIAQMFETTAEFYSSNSDVTLLTNTPKITSVDVPKRLRRLQDGESGVTINYDHTFEYISNGGEELEANDLATQALADEGSRTQFLEDLKSRDSSFIDLTGVTATDATPPETPPTAPPTKAPSVTTAGTDEEPEDDDDIFSNTYVLIGIGVGVLLLLFIMLMCCRKGRNKTAEETASPRSAAAASPKSTGARSVQEEAPEEPTTREELIHVFAPPGKLGVVIDTPSDGASFVHAVKPTSIIADRIKVGDKLVAVDDEDVRTLSAINVSKLIGKKSSQPTRKLTVLRTISVENP